MYAQVSNLIYQKRLNHSFLPLSSLICTTRSRKLARPRGKLSEHATVKSLFGQTNLELRRSLSRSLVHRHLLSLSLSLYLLAVREDPKGCEEVHGDPLGGERRVERRMGLEIWVFHMNRVQIQTSLQSFFYNQPTMWRFIRPFICTFSHITYLLSYVTYLNNISGWSYGSPHNGFQKRVTN